MSARKVALALALAALISGCGPDMKDLEQKVTDVKSRKSVQIEPIPQVKAYEAISYAAAERRDPFIPQKPEVDETEVVSGGPGPDLNRNKEPLEEFPLDGLRMAGTIQAGGATFALVRAPDGVIHRVTVGNYLGQNYGQIKAIDEAEVQLVETVEDGFGGWTTRPATLALAE